MKHFVTGLITTIFLGLAQPAMAQHHHGFRHMHGHHHHGHRWFPGHGWVAPMVIGGVITYAITRPDPVIVQQPTVIVQAPKDQVVIDGVVYTKQIMIINGQQTEVLVKQ